MAVFALSLSLCLPLLLLLLLTFAIIRRFFEAGVACFVSFSPAFALDPLKDRRIEAGRLFRRERLIRRGIYTQSSTNKNVQGLYACIKKNDA